MYDQDKLSNRNQSHKKLRFKNNNKFCSMLFLITLVLLFIRSLQLYVEFKIKMQYSSYIFKFFILISIWILNLMLFVLKFGYYVFKYLVFITDLINNNCVKNFIFLNSLKLYCFYKLWCTLLFNKTHSFSNSAENNFPATCSLYKLIKNCILIGNYT